MAFLGYQKLAPGSEMPLACSKHDCYEETEGNNKKNTDEFQSQLASWSQLLVLQKRDFLTLLYELCSDYQIEAPISAESVILSVSKATVSPPP